MYSGPVASLDPNFGHLKIKEDVLYQKDAAPYSDRDLHVRVAVYVLSQAVPIVAASLIMRSRKLWWCRKYDWTMARLVVFWLLSIQIFGAIVYAQKGATTRILFLAATLHLQIEYMIIALLLKSSPFFALSIAYLAGTILLTIKLFVSDLSIVYIITTISGFTDFLIPILLVYGRQWLYSVGGFAHLVQAIGVFCIVVKNYGHIQFAVITFVSTWIMNGALVAAIYNACTEGTSNGTSGHIQLSDDENSSSAFPVHVKVPQRGEASDNPLTGITIPRCMLFTMFAVSIIGSTISAFIFTFVVARN